MGGSSARRGFAFQDWVLLDKALAQAVELTAARADSRNALVPNVRFAAEGQPAPGAPDWDLLQVETGDDATSFAIFTEVKGGAMTPADRRVFWRRLRRTVGLSNQPWHARLVVDADNLPSAIDSLRDLHSAASAFVDEDLPPRPTGPVTTAEEMLAEALWELCREDDKKRSSTLDLRTAVALLSEFEVDATRSRADIEQSVVERLLALGVGITRITACKNQLRGFVDRRAEAYDEAEHWFTTAELLQEVSTLTELAEVGSAVVHLWQEWSSATAERQRASSHGLSDQPWRDVQPEVAAKVDSDSEGRVALTGPGGSGKTVLLEMLLDELRQDESHLPLLLRSTDLHGRERSEIEEVLRLGSFVSDTKGQSLVVLADGLEHLHPLSARQKAVSALLANSNPSIDVYVACRTTQWDQLEVPLREEWNTVELAPWPEDRVRELVELGTRSVDDKLRELLQSPLLLDIFLLTFGQDREVPAGLQTRHGIVQAYFNERVFRPHGEVSSGSVSKYLLEDLALREARAKGPCSHEAVGLAADAMLSEGLLVPLGNTRVVFRHDLLRDYVLHLWARGPLHDGESVAAVLSKVLGVERPFVRHGTLRALVESLQGPDDNETPKPSQAELFEVLVSEDQARELFEVLGGLDDPTDVDLLAVDRRLPEAATEWETASTLFRAIRHGRRGEWVQCIAALPVERRWAESSKLLDKASVYELALLLEAYTPADGLVAIGERIERWSRCDRFRPRLERDQDYGWQVAIRTVARGASSSTTVDWMREVVGRSWRTRFAVLDVLPTLASDGLADGSEADPNTLLDLFIEAAGIDIEEGLATQQQEISDAYHALERALLGHDLKDVAGLLTSQPRAFLPLVFDLLAGEADAENRDPLDPALEETFRELWQADREPPTELEAKLSKQCKPTDTPDAVLGGLVDDIGRPRYAESGERWRRSALSWIQGHLRRARDCDDLDTIETYWHSARESRSAVGRLVLLDMLTESEHCCGEIADEVLEIVDEVLADGRMYHLYAATFFIWRAIQQRWDGAPADVQNRILENIRLVQRSPLLNGVFAVGPLLSAVPTQACPDDLSPFLELYDERGWDPTPKLPEPIRVRAGSPEEEGFEDPFRDRDWEDYGRFEMGPEAAARWRELWDLNRQKLTDSREALQKALGLMQALAGDLPSRPVLGKRTWPLDRMRTIIEAAWIQRDELSEKQPQPILPPEVLESVFRWSLALAASEDLSILAQEASDPIDTGAFGSAPRSTWANALRLLDALLLIEPLDQATYRERVFNEVRRARQMLSPTMARDLFTSIRAYHWFAPEGGGRDLLRDLLSEEVSDAGALLWARPMLRYFSSDQQQFVLTRWLSEPHVAGAAGAQEELAREVGKYLGSGTLRREGRELWPRELVNELLEHRPEAGLLSEDVTYQQWLLGLVQGMQMGDGHDAPWRGSPDDYAQYADRLWDRLHVLDCFTNPPSRNHWPNFTLFAFRNVLGDHVDHDTRRLQWDALANVLTRIVNEGPASEIFHLVFELRDSEAVDVFGPDRIIRVLTQLGQRLAKDPTQVNRAQHPRDNWGDVVRYACQALINVARADPQRRDALLGILENLGNHDIVKETRVQILQP